MPKLDVSTVRRVIEKSFLHPRTALRRAAEAVKHAALDADEERNKLYGFLENAYFADPHALVAEYLQSGFPDWMYTRRTALAQFPGPYRFGSTPKVDCESLYLLVRALKPRVVIETGVCYGMSSAYILEALERNGNGELYSIDLGNTDDEPPNDFFIPRRLLHRWNLIVGDVRDELRPLLQRLTEIDMFHHDSLHTYEHMMWEYETALPYIQPGGALSSHDVRTIVDLGNPFGANPFEVFCRERQLRSVMAQNFGAAVV